MTALQDRRRFIAADASPFQWKLQRLARLIVTALTRSEGPQRLNTQDSKLKTRELHPEELAGRVEDLLVHFGGAPVSRELLDASARRGSHKLGELREPRFRGGRPVDGHRLSGLNGMFRTCVCSPL